MRKKVSGIVLVISLVVMAISGCQLAEYEIETANAQKDFEKFSVKQQDEEPEGKADKYKRLREENHNLKAWLRIPESKYVNYPVMQTKKDPQYYLYRNFDKQYSASGSLFIDSNCDVATSANILVHGHNMQKGTMFGHLKKYLDNGYFDKHKTVCFDVIGKNGKYESREYEVFAVVMADLREGNAYFDYTAIEDEETFEKYLEFIRENACVTTDYVPKWGDRLLTLSTCSYHVPRPYGRIAVIAVETGKMEEQDE